MKKIILVLLAATSLQTFALFNAAYFSASISAEGTSSPPNLTLPQAFDRVCPTTHDSHGMIQCRAAIDVMDYELQFKQACSSKSFAFKSGECRCLKSQWGECEDDLGQKRPCITGWQDIEAANRNFNFPEATLQLEMGSFIAEESCP